MLYGNLMWGAGKGKRSKRGAGLGNVGLPTGYSASTRGVSWSSTTKESSFSSAMRALSLPSSSNRCRHSATGMRSSTHPCAYCPLGFETLNKFEFRNRGGADDSLDRPQCVHGAALGARGRPGPPLHRRGALREGFERTINSIRARGGWDVYLSEFELEMCEESEKGLWLTANWHSGARRLVRRRARGRHPGGAEVPGVPDELARLLAEEKEEGVEGGVRKAREGRGDVDEEAW